MLCITIWVDRVVPRSGEAVMGYKELDIVTMEKTYKESSSRKQPSKANSLGSILPY